MTLDKAIDTICEIAHLTALEKELLLMEYEIASKKEVSVSKENNRTLYDWIVNSAKGKIAVSIAHPQQLIQTTDFEMIYN